MTPKQQDERSRVEAKFSLEYKYGFWAFGRCVPFHLNPYDKTGVEGANWEAGWCAAKENGVMQYEL